MYFLCIQTTGQGIRKEAIYVNIYKLYTCIYIYIYVYIYIYMHTYIYKLFKKREIYIHMHMYMYIYRFICVYTAGAPVGIYKP